MASNKLVVEIIGDSKSLTRALKGSEDSLKGFGRRVSSMSTALKLGIAGATTAMAGFGVVAAKSGAQFEDTMQRIVGLSGVAQKSVNQFTGEVLKLAPSVGRGPQELAEALFFITSSGIKAADAMGVLAASAQASVAGLGETKVVADAVTSAINAYGSANLSATQATDVLVSTVREGKGEAAEFAGVIGNVAALASQLGVSFNDVGSALAAMTRLGTNAETSSIQLQQVFSNLVKVAPQAEKAFKSVGLSSAGLRKEIADKGLLAGLKTIKAAFGDDLPTLARAFGDIRALRGVLALVGNQAESTAGIFNRLADSSGSLKTAFGAVSGDTAQQFRKMKAAVQVGVIAVGAAIAPLAELVAKGIGAAATALTSFIERFSKAKTIRAKFNVVIDGIRDLGQRIVQEVGKQIERVDFAQAAAALQQQLFVVLRTVGETLDRINFSEVGRAIGDGVARGAQTAAAFLRSVDWSAVGNEIVNGIRAFLTGVNWKAVAAGMVNLLVAAIKANVALLKGVGAALGQALLDGIKAGLRALGVAAERLALNVVLKIAKAFDFKLLGQSLVPGVGALVEKIEAKLDALAAHAKNAGDAVGAAVSKAIGESNRSAAVPTETAKPRSTAGTAITTTPATVVATTKAVETAAEKAKRLFDHLLDGLQLGLEKAQQTKPFEDDLAAIAKIIAALRQRAAVAKNDLDVQHQLVTALGQQRDIIKEQAAAAKDLRTQRQFQALGLNAQGGDIIPGADNLRKQLASLTDRLGASPVKLSSKLQSQLAGVRKILSGSLGKTTAEVRAKIAELFATIRGEFEKGAKGPLTKTTTLNTTSILKGLGLAPADERTIRARLSHFDSAGIALSGAGRSVSRAGSQREFSVNVPDIFIDGRKVTSNVSGHQARTRRRNPSQRRGPNVGQIRG